MRRQRRDVAIHRLRLRGCTIAAAVAAIAMASALASSAAHAQTKTGTTLGQFLLIEPSARIAGMGNAGASLGDGLDAGYYNPAAIGKLERLSFLFSHSDWLADIRYDYIAGALPMGRWGNAYATLTSLGSGDIDVRTVDSPLGTGERFTVSDLALGLGYAKRITDRFSVGLLFNYVQETIWHSSTSTTTINLGTLYEWSENGLTIGSSLSNFGTQGRYEGRDLRILYDSNPDVFGDNSALPAERFTDGYPVPVLFRVGLSMPYRVSRIAHFQFALDAFHPNDNTESVSAGTEFTYRDQFALRAGYQNLFLQDSEMGLTAGGGFQGDIQDRPFRLDYAWAGHRRLGSTHRLTLGIDF